MKINSFKYSIFPFIFSILFVILTILGLVIVFNYSIIGTILDILFLVMAIYFFVITLINIQMFKLTNNKIIVKNIFGVIKEVSYSEIKRIEKMDTTVYSLKMMNIKKNSIILFLNKSVKESQIEDAYNRKKNKYIVLPYNKKIYSFIENKI